MQDHIKYLVVEDQPDWSESIGSVVRNYFLEQRKFAGARIREFSAVTGRQADQLISEGGWDLVMLDMNLGEGAGREKISGLDLLGEIAEGNKAYFVIIVTGAVNDPTLEQVYGAETASRLRFGALNEAVKKLPAARVRIVHKPDAVGTDEALGEILPHLHSALDQYCAVSLERNIFRPLPGDPNLWEICYNGGSRLTLKHEANFDLIRSSLAQPNRALKVIQLIQALAQSSSKGGATVVPDKSPKAHRRSAGDLEYRGHQEDEVQGEDGLDWSEMDGFSIADNIPIDTDDGALDLEVLLGALLLAKAQRLDLLIVIENFADCYGEAALLSLPGRAAKLAADGIKACQRFSSDDAPQKLGDLARDLRPLLKPMRERWLESKEKGAIKSGSKKSKTVRVAKGSSAKELGKARKDWERFKTSMESHPALSEFHEHMVRWVDRSPTAKGHFFYRPPSGDDLCPFWLTE